jgi:hypothetical protein
VSCYLLEFNVALEGASKSFLHSQDPEQKIQGCHTDYTPYSVSSGLPLERRKTKLANLLRPIVSKRRSLRASSDTPPDNRTQA